MAHKSTLINKHTARYCYLDLDLDGHRSKLARAAAFVHATDTRYGFSSNDWRSLGGSERARIPMLYDADHEWSNGGDDGDTSNGSIAIRPPDAGTRLLLRLDWETAPLACENFATLCANRGNAKPTGESGGKAPTYLDSNVHRIVPGFVLQGGDYVFGNGSGGASVFGHKNFKDERAGLVKRHDRRGLLSMGNSGKHSNSSQWFLTLASAPQCNGKHVIFGELVSGWELLDAAEALGTVSGEPTARVRVTECGLWTENGTDPAAGYWFDVPYPDSYTGVSPLFVVRPRVAVVVPSSAVYTKFVQALAPQCVLVEVIIRPAAQDADTSVADSCSDTDGPSSVYKLLNDHAVDLVVLAPACAAEMKNELATLVPTSWAKRAPDEVILIAKPVASVRAVREDSWIAKRTTWSLDH